MEHPQQRAITLCIKTDPHLPAERIPRYATAGAAGADLCAFLKEPKILARGERALIPTGLYFEIPEGFEVQIRPRSGLAYKFGITVANAPGTIDSDYRGEIKVLLINLGDEAFEVTDGMRVAQMVIAPVFIADFERIEELATTARNGGGFGHTGLSV